MSKFFKTITKMSELQSKVDLKTLSSSLGHATVGFTLDTYGHVSNAMKQDAANKMEDLITHI